MGVRLFDRVGRRVILTGMVAEPTGAGLDEFLPMSMHFRGAHKHSVVGGWDTPDRRAASVHRERTSEVLAGISEGSTRGGGTTRRRRANPLLRRVSTR